MAEGIVERPERYAPQFVPVGSVREKTEFREEHIGVLAIGSGSRRGRAVIGFLLLPARARRFTPPQNLSRGSIQRNGVELLLLDSRQKDSVTGHRGRRVAGRRR